MRALFFSLFLAFSYHLLTHDLRKNLYTGAKIARFRLKLTLSAAWYIINVSPKPTEADMKQEDIRRMNELYHLSQERALSEDEFAEWEELKKRYVADFKANLTAQLDNTYIVDEKGNLQNRAGGS